MPTGRRTSDGARRRRATAAALAVCAVLHGFTLTACQGGAKTPADSVSSSTASAQRTPTSAPSPAASPAWDTAPGSIAAVGDSITSAFDACEPLAECPKASWATGTDPAVGSLTRRLLDRPAKDSWNLAAPGATMADLPGQMAQAARHTPELVTVLMGTNDACGPSVEAMTPVSEFRADFEEALRVLRSEAPKAQVYVASIPDLERLWRVGRGHPDARRAWRFGVCPAMLRAPRATGDAADARRESVSERVREYNGVLREVCTAQRWCRWDGGAVHDFRFTAEALSAWDWFHPSRRGQRELAALAYACVTDR